MTPPAPPHRSGTAARPTKPSANPPKGRKIVRGEQLKRNTACLNCRRRRIRCDAGKPHCASCLRSAQYLARTQPNERHTIQCHYENGSDCSDNDDPADQLLSTVHEAFEHDAHSQSPPIGIERRHSEPVVRSTAAGKPQYSGSYTKRAVELADARMSTSQTYFQYALSGPSPMVDAVSEQYPSLQFQTTIQTQPAQLQLPTELLEGMSWGYSEPQAITGAGLAGAFSQPQQHNATLMFSPPSLTSLSLAPKTTLPSMNTSVVDDDDNFDALPPLQRRASGVITVEGLIGDGSGEMDQLLMMAAAPGPAPGLEPGGGNGGGWPSSLPSHTLVNDLVNVFFTMVPSISRIIHRTSLLTRLSCPPTNPEFPHHALIHAICAIAAQHAASVRSQPHQTAPKDIGTSSKDASRDRLDGLVPGEEERFSGEQAMLASGAMEGLGNVGGRELFDVLQATVLMCHWTQSDSRWIDCWTSLSLATRLISCLGLLNDDDHHYHPAAGAGAEGAHHHSALHLPKTDAEREERRAVLWYVVLLDTAASACSGWPGTLPHDEISARLPAARVDSAGSSLSMENPQSHTSPDFYHNHPAPDSFVMLLKGQMLLYRAARFVRRCRSMTPEERAQAREADEFRQIEGDLATLSLTFPSALRDPIQYVQGDMKTPDVDLISAHIVPHVVAIHLHEPFANVKDPECTSATRLLSEARACLKIVYLMIGSSTHISHMVVPITSCDYIYSATRPLLMFYRTALEAADAQAASTLYSEITVLKNVFTWISLCRFMGMHYLTMINSILDTIEQETIGRPVVNGDFPNLRPSSSSSAFITSASGEGGLFSSMPQPQSKDLQQTVGSSTAFEMPAIPSTDAAMMQELKDALRLAAAESRGDEAGKGKTSGMGGHEAVQGMLSKIGGFAKTAPVSMSGPGASMMSDREIPAEVGNSIGMAEGDLNDPLRWLDWQSLGPLGEPPLDV
ncbi:hypothetical protein IAR50_005619 [Cryptococcus sp. DSM 104548]